MEYRCVATSVEGFIQQLAVAYVTHGYWFYVTGIIPEEKDPAAVDAKLIDCYSIAISKWARCRRKKQGLANVQYLRHERFFVLLATKGRHAFFEREHESIRDVRRVPIKFAGHSISARKGPDGLFRPSVRIQMEQYRNLRAYLFDLAARQSEEAVAIALDAVRFQRYAGVRRQLLNIRAELVGIRRGLSSRLTLETVARARRRSVLVFARRERVQA